MCIIWRKRIYIAGLNVTIQYLVNDGQFHQEDHFAHDTASAMVLFMTCLINYYTCMLSMLLLTFPL